MNSFHNIDLERNAIPEIKERNKKILTAYNNIIMTIDRMQGYCKSSAKSGPIVVIS